MLEALVVAAAFTGPAPIDTGAAKTEIAAACGASPDIEIDWRSFGDDDDALHVLRQSKVMFLAEAFATVCADAAAKPEVGKQILKIRLSQAHGAADPVVYLTQRTLHVEYLWMKGEPVPDAAFVAAEIKSRLKGEEAEAP